MENPEITKALETGFETFEIEYKNPEHKRKYGSSFEAISKGAFTFVKVNGGTFKAKRVVEEFGNILFIYNGEQVSFKAEDIFSVEVLEVRAAAY